MKSIDTIQYPVFFGGLSANLPRSAYEVSRSKPLRAKTYNDLIRMVAALASANPEYRLLFRGQTRDYCCLFEGSYIIPSIYRLNLKGSRKQGLFDPAIERLNEAELTLSCIVPFDIRDRLRRKVERWAVLQHYEVCATPLLDMTSSLAVACWFALHDASAGHKPIVYVFGLPYLQGPLSFDLSSGIFQLELTSLLPPIAERPVFQNGYLVGTEDDLNPRKSYCPDYSKRLIGKIEIDNSPEFYSSIGISYDHLFPKVDPFLQIIEQVEWVMQQDDEFAWNMCEHMFDGYQSDSLNNLFGFESVPRSYFLNG